jgi:3-hydroxybutyryl-CoA dehydratase
MSDFHVGVGESVQFSKTVGESDVNLFAGITGDLGPNHVNEAYMQQSAYGGRIAHGALLIGYMSTASTMMCARSVAAGIDETPVSVGYDRVRFLKGVRLNDTITVTYRIKEIDPERRRSRSAIEVTNQSGEVVAVAEHILQWVQNPKGQAA